MESDQSSGTDQVEPVRVDDVEDRVQAEVQQMEGRAKERAGQGMQNEELEREGREQKEEARRLIEEDRGNS